MSQHNPPQARPHVVRNAKGKRPQFYEAPGLDQAMSMILVLANELSVERVFKAKEMDLASEIEDLKLDQEALESREAWRQNFLERLYYLARKDAGEAAAAETDEKYNATIEGIAVG
jgi:hypothetical protein